MAISLKEAFGDDAQEVKNILIMFSSRGQNDAQIVSYRTLSGSELADRGIQKSEDHANQIDLKWSEKAMSALCRFVVTHKGRFQAEDVRKFAVHVPHPPSLRAWGGIMVKAARLGLIRSVGYEKVNNPLAHGTPAAVWETV